MYETESDRPGGALTTSRYPPLSAYVVMPEPNPYKTPGPKSSRTPVKPERRWPSATFSITGALLIAGGVMIDVTTFIPPRPLLANVAEVVFLAGGTGFLIAAYRKPKR